MTDTILRTLRTHEKGIVLINGPITDQLALDFSDELDVLYDYYKFETVLVRIHSPGGQILALDYMMERIDHWRAQGRKLHTQATMQAVSAAALLLSLGEVGHRYASRCSALLYHRTRFMTQASQTITATAAMEAVQELIGSDDRMMKRLCSHLLQGFGGPQAFAKAGNQRIQALCDLMTSHPQEEKPAWVKNTKDVYIQVLGAGDIKPYQALLMGRFDEDTTMSQAQAWALMLIDDVDGLAIKHP
jgi:ATP-dependent protease ClpP protease subunit